MSCCLRPGNTPRHTDNDNRPACWGSAGHSRAGPGIRLCLRWEQAQNMQMEQMDFKIFYKDPLS